MNSTQKKFLVAGTVLAIAVGYLGFSGVKKGWVYFLPVDQFATGREVVVEGKYDSAGVFQADLLMTKCASKYEGKGHPGRERA